MAQMFKHARPTGEVAPGSLIKGYYSGVMTEKEYTEFMAKHGPKRPRTE